ncbi:MAG: hypothetical protein MH321_06075 [Leptospiraceae bacterium]|nr:hypothetical protein [Leptospiraceae bacterium]
MILTIADVIIESLNISVCVNAEINPLLNSELTAAVGKKFNQGSKFDIDVSLTNDGRYLLNAKNPIIVASLYVRKINTVKLNIGMKNSTLHNFTGITSIDRKIKKEWEDWEVIEK